MNKHDFNALSCMYGVHTRLIIKWESGVAHLAILPNSHISIVPGAIMVKWLLFKVFLLLYIRFGYMA